MLTYLVTREGQDIIEYALLAAFISIVAWGILVNIGVDVKDIYTSTEKATSAAKDSAAAAS